MNTSEGAKKAWETKRANGSDRWKPKKYKYKGLAGRIRDENCEEALDRPGFWRTSVAFSIKEKEKYTQLVDHLVTEGSNFHEFLMGAIEEELAKRKVILE